MTDSDPAASADVAEAQLEKARALVVKDEDDDAEAVLDALTAAFGDTSEPQTRAILQRGALLKAFVLERTGRRGEALGLVEGLLSGDLPPELSDVAVDAALMKTSILRAQGRSEEAIQTAGRMFADYQDDPDPQTRDRVARALSLQEEIYEQTGRVKPAIGTCDAIVSLLDDSTDPEMRVRLVGAMVRRGHYFERLWRFDKALAAYDEVLGRFAEGESPGVDERVVWTREQLDLIEQAKMRGLKKFVGTLGLAAIAVAARRRGR